MDTSDLAGMADYQLIGDAFGYHSGYGSASGQPTGQSGQPQQAGLPVPTGNMPSSAVLSGISTQSSAQAYHQLQSQHQSRAAYPQSNDPLIGHKIHSQYPNYGSGGSAVQTLVRGQYPTPDPRYVQHGIADYNSAMSQSHLQSLQSGAPSQPPMPTSAYGQQNMIGQYAGQRMHSPGITPSRQPSGPMHGMPSHYSASYPSAPTQAGYHSHANPNSDLWTSQGVPHMQQSSSYPGYPGSGPSGPSSLPSQSHPPGVSMHGPRARQSQYVSHSEYSASAMHGQEQQRQYYSSSGGPTGTQSMTGHIPSDGPTLPYPTPPQGPYSGSSSSQQVPQQTSNRGTHSGINASVPRQQYMGYNSPASLQPQPPSQVSQAAQQQSSGSSISRYPQQYPGYPQPSSYGESSAQSRLSPYPLSQTGPAGPNSPQFRPGYPSSAGPQISSLSPRRPTTTPPAGSPMPPSSHTPDRSAPNASASQAPSHQSSFPISPGANHLSSPVQGMSPGSSVPSTPSSLQQLEQMVMPHLGGVQTNSKPSIPVSTNSSSSSSSTSSYYGSVGPTTPSTGAAPPSPQPPNSGQRQTQSLYSHYPTTGNQSQYQYHQYQQNSTHWSGPQPNQTTPVAVSSSSSATPQTNTHSMGGVSGGIPLQPQSTLPSIGQSTQSSNTNLQQHQNSPSVASNSSSPNVSKSDVSIPATNSMSGQYNSFGSEMNAVSASDSNYSQTFVSRSTTSSTNSTPSSSSSSSQPLQSGYNVSQSTNSNSASFDSPVIKAQHKQQAAQNDTQQSQQQQSQSQAAVAQLASPTNIFDSIKSPNAGTPRPLSANDLQQQQQQSNQSECIPNSQAVQGTQPLIPGVQHHSHHPYHQMMHQQQVHQSYPTQQQIPNYQNSYDPGLNYDMNAVTSDMTQSSSYGEHDSSLMYDTYGMDSMVPPQMADYHRDSAGDFGPLDPYSSANFDDSYGEPPTKRKGKGRPKKDPNEPKKERKPRQPRAPRGTGRGRGRGNKNNVSDRMPPMPPSVMMPPEYEANFGMQSENMDIYSHDMYGQHLPPSAPSITQQQSQSIPSMPLTPSAPPPPQQQPIQAPPPPPPPPPPPQSPPQQQQTQTNHSQQQLPIQQQQQLEQPPPLPPPQQQPQIETPITSPVPSVQSHDYTPPIAEQPIPQIIEKPLENEQSLYEDNFSGHSSISESNNLNETTLISMPTDEEPNLSVAVPSEGDLYTPPRQISPCPPPTTDEVIPEPKIDSYEFADEQFASTPVKSQKQKKAKKRKPKKEPEEEPDSEVKPPKSKKTKKRKKQKQIPNETEEIELKEPQIDEVDSSIKVSQTTDFDDATQESSQCESSAIESSTGKSSSKKEKSSRRGDSKPKKPKIKNKSPKKKLPKLALKFSKNKKRRRLGSPDHSDLERTPPPSPDEADSGIQKRRSARNTKRQKYTDDIELELSDDDQNLDGRKVDSNGVLIPLNTDGKAIGDSQVVSVVTNINEDTMVVEKIMTSRLAQRELEDENPETTETDPNFKAPTIEVEEYFVKYKNLSYFHCEWKTEEELEKGDRRISQKIKRFKQKRDFMNMFDFLDEEPYNPDYIEVDRILDVNEIEEIIEVFPTNIETVTDDKIVDKTKEETETPQNETEKTETDVTNDDKSSLVPNESEKMDLEISETNEKDKSENSEQKADNDDDTQDNCETESVKKIEAEEKEAEIDEDVKEEKEKDTEVKEEETEEKEKVSEVKEKETEETESSDKETEQLIEEPVKTRKVKHYLVKWRALAYEDSTWELEDDLDPLKVEQFWKFRKPPPKNEWKPKRRPKSAEWKKIEDSPVFKGDNTLREYQLEGLNWLSFCWHNGQNCILADEMGLGKTIQSIAFINEICNHGIPGPFLVIAPLSTIGNWQREFETWTDLNVITYHGSSASRNMLQEYEMYYKNDKHERIPGIYKFQVMITTFEIVLTDCLELREIHWKTCVIDEAHRLKNRNCKLLEGLRLLDMEHRVLLTGTPLQNNVEELFSLLNFLEPTQFTSNESFMLEFGDLKTETQVDKLKAILKPMMLRRLKEDVEKSLAPKEETIVEVELTNVQKKYYRAILERNFQFLSKGGTYANMPNLMNTMMELRKCCIHPFLINGAEDQIMIEYRQQHGGDNTEGTVNAIVQASGKLVLIDKLLPRLRANGHRVLLFSQMVRCLDILEDYMVQKRYPYERIDGRVRGNLRQAAIDRFCKPDSDRFVFLLCTRAGGLGINLTAADTVIIFDSDWNPQNDLQAQARCHRIGQSKAVKVYRLICRNTYEREMFDKASLKLGLDRAVLQSLNSQKASLAAADAALSKKEIEDLLRKGAYGALMEDDNAGDKFCEEDIEQILQRRTQKIIIESEGKGSTFSKASFASSSNRSDIEIDDPNFWEKWAKKANFDVDELKGRNDLIVQEPRRRTQTKRFGADDAVLDMSELESSDEDDDSVSMRTRGGRNRLPKGKKGKKGRGGGYERERDEDYLQEFGPGNWTRAECYKVEKGLLTFGWGRWGECLVLGNFRRQLSRLDVESISRVLLLYALQNYKGDEKIKSFIWDLITPNEDGEHIIHRNHSGLSAPVPRGRKNKKLKKTVGEELESADWAKDDKFNPDVLLTDDMYRKHLHRHANKILLRVRLLYYLKHEIIGDLHEQVFSGISAHDIPIPPPVADGDPPAIWWDEDADKSLLVGVYKHGYDRFNLMRQDPALCFLHRCGPPDGAALLAEMNADDDLIKTLDEDDEPETPATPATPLSESDCVKNKPEKSDSITKDEPEITEQSGAFLPFPSAADMNHRLRRVVTSYQRNFKKQEMKLAQRARHQQRLERLERFEAAIKEREIKKREQAQKKWSRREEADFYRVVSSFGVEYKRDEDRYEWTRFRSFGRLERKLDETLTEYFKAFYAMCKRVTGRRLTEEEENLPISVDPISEERASRCLARIDLLSKIREEILTHPEIDERLQLCQHSMDLPDWWVCGKHDKDLLIGAAKYGLNRLDFNLMSDTELSFSDIFKQFEIANDKKNETNEQKITENKTDCEESNKLEASLIDPKPEDKKQEDPKEINNDKKSEDQVIEENTDSKKKSEDKSLSSEVNEEKEITEKDDVSDSKPEEEVKSETIKEEPKELSAEIDVKIDEKVEEDSPKPETPVIKDKSLREILDRKDNVITEKSELCLNLSEDNKETLKSETEVIDSKDKDKDIDMKDIETDEKEEKEEKLNSEINESKSEEKMECDEEKKEETDGIDDKKDKPEELKEDEKSEVKTEEQTKSVETNESENTEIKTESESKPVVTETEVSVTNTSTPQQQPVQQKSSLRWPKDRVLQMRLEQICHTVDKNEWPSLRHSFFSLISGPMTSTPSVATADSSPRPLSPCSLSSASREPTPHPTPDHTPRREALSPLPDFFYTGDTSVSMNDSASRRRRRRRRRFEVEAERAKLRNLLTHTIEQQQQQQQMPSKKQTSLLSGSNPQFLPPLFTLPFCNLRSAIRDELMSDEKAASLLLGQSLQSSLAAAAAAASAQSTASTTTTTTISSNSKGPPPAHQNSSVRSNQTMGTLDLTGRFKSSPKIATPPAPAHKPAPPAESRVASQDVLDLSSGSVPPKRSRGSSPAKKSSQSESNPTPNTSSKKNSRKIGSRIDALALNLQAKKMMEEKQSDPKPDKIDSNMSSIEKRQATYFMDELNKHSALIQSKLGSNPPAAHSGTSNQSSKLNDASLLNKSSAHFGALALDASKLPPSKVNEASSIVEQVAIIRQNLRSLFEDHPEFIAQNPSMASMVAASAANVFNPNISMNTISSIPANTELLELPDSRRRGRRTRIDPSQLDMQHLTGEENVSVINRTTGKKITGSKAPPLKHLAEWLDKNPKFDVDPKWSPLIKEKAATFKTPTSLSNIGVRTRTSDKRGSNSSNSGNSNMNMNASNLLNNNLNNSSGNSGSSSSKRSTAASLLAQASGYGNAFGTPSTSSGLNFPSSAALNSLGFNASMLAAGFPSMKMFMDPTSSSMTSSSTATTSKSSSTTSATTTTTPSSGSGPPLFFPFGGLAGMGLANPLFGFPSFNLPGLNPNSNMSGSSFQSDKKESDNSSIEKSSKSSGKSSSSSKNKNNMNSNLMSSSAAASALGSGALPFLYPSPNFLYNPLSLSGFSLPSSPFALAAHTGLMNGLGNLSTSSMSGYTPTYTTNSSNTSHSSKTRTTSSKSSKSHSASASNVPSGLSLASSLLASAGVHPSSAAAAAAIGDSDDDSLKSLMGNDDDDDLNGDFDDKDIIDNSDFEMEAKSATTKKKSSSSKSSSKDLTKSKKGNSITTSKVSPN